MCEKCKEYQSLLEAQKEKIRQLRKMVAYLQERIEKNKEVPF